MNGGKILDKVVMQLRNEQTGDVRNVKINVYDSSLSRKWLSALNVLLKNNYLLEKNYCFMGFVDSDRNGAYILDRVNQSIAAINASGIGYTIDDYFDMSNCITDEHIAGRPVGRNIVHDKFNRLHRYFEDLQGVSGSISGYYNRAGADIRWHIRQLNLLCHEFESWALSYRKQVEAPEWSCPSQLMCWLNAPRFELDTEDLSLFGIESLNRKTGGVYVGVNKAVGKHHWEVFNDEGRDSRVSELTTSTLKSQTEAAGDFDIEWGREVGHLPHRQRNIEEFRQWLLRNNFDPEDPKLTIGHPMVAQVDLLASFGTNNCISIWQQLHGHLDVYKITTSDAEAIYDYSWRDSDFDLRQIHLLGAT